jgi:hypothetical protein
MIHILNGKRMPYRMMTSPHTLVISHRVNLPDPDIIYEVVEVPATLPLRPGEVFSEELALPVETVSDHYQASRTPATLRHDRIQLRCEVGWGDTPIKPSEHVSMSQLLAWQKITAYGPFDVVLP